jgi:hypothetical protein
MFLLFLFLKNAHNTKSCTVTPYYIYLKYDRFFLASRNHGHMGIINKLYPVLHTNIFVEKNILSLFLNIF